MPEQMEYIQKSVELNLFFLRLMKEHALFLQLGFTPKNTALANEAGVLRKLIADLLQRVVIYGAGHVSKAVLSSGELFTRYTFEAERQTQTFTGAPPQIDLDLTEDEYDLAGRPGGDAMPPSDLRMEIDEQNRLALDLTTKLLQFKQRVQQDVLACRIITTNYPSLIDHVIREARHYIEMLRQLISGGMMHSPGEMANHEVFWDHIMHEHAEFIGGQLDPSEKALKRTAGAFSRQYERLLKEAEAATKMLQTLPEVTTKSETLTASFRNFKAQGTQGILSCKVRSVILPLMADHVLREANHYLRMLRESHS